MRSLALTIVCFFVGATGALAQEAMSTAGASGNPPTAETARQIDAWIAGSPAVRDQEEGVLSGFGRPRDGRIHGQVELGVGTGGYRSGSITTVAPIGDSGTLMLHFGQSKNDYRYWMDGYRLRDGRPLLP
ncbi:hypothetical protein [Phenylobacterium sp.]|jgi:hypothetical protein|uniref:hypothetical protein n=1 Tax=Phenylobacterium sp. TaxID=1871053 RepID=UPI0035AEC227